MVVELLCVDSDLSQKDIQKVAFQCVDKNIDYICVPPIYINDIKSIAVNNLAIAAQIDYPLGISSLELKIHSILSSLRSGAKTIDIVLNTNHIKNNKWGDLTNEIDKCNDLAFHKNFEVRYILENSYFTDEKVLEVCNILCQNNITSLILGSGLYIDDLADQLILAKKIQETSCLLVFLTTNAWRSTQFEMIHNTGIHGLRLKTISALKSFLVYKSL